ncbi:DUF4338 domain-containing protein [Gammaproteobacteria bacterium]|nr:DUF4338 domain-containing protein [Gammaproteobacteria bacterium]
MKLELSQSILNKIAVYLEIVHYQSLDKTELSSHIRAHELQIPTNSFSMVHKAALLVIADLVDQGWSLEVQDLGSKVNINSRLEINVEAPEIKQDQESLDDAKARIRKGHLVGVHNHLKKPEIQTFISKLHEGNRNTKSITLLIDDPKDLINQCLSSFNLENDDSLLSVLDPYVQMASNDIRDKFTNQRLSDIWRYFRLTWSLEYKTNPGRSLPFLIRNKARKNHPVIGIAMMASPVLGLKPRDQKLALTKESFLKFAYKEKISLQTIIGLIDQDIKKILKKTKYDDLLSPDELKNLNQATLESLGTAADRASNERIISQKINDESKSEELLFKSKRATRLKKILTRKITLNALKKDVKKFNLKLKDIDRNRNFLDLLGSFITDKRTEVMSSDIMDISVCGAVFPYNHLIGGKLVALLMTSNEARDIFNERYQNSDSQIAQKMAGRKLRKRSNLRCLTTTSIYGVGSSQYNRLKVSIPKGRSSNEIKWERVGESDGYGTYHFSSKTQESLDELLNIQGKSTSVNYKFGEGTSPRMRRLRESMSNLGFKSDKFFQHQSKRITYLCDLYKSTPHEIFGIRESKHKNISQKKISKAWRQRWLESRIQKPEIQEKLYSANPNNEYLIYKLKQIKKEFK